MREGRWLWPPGHRPLPAVECRQCPRDAPRSQPAGHVNVQVLGMREELSDCLLALRWLFSRGTPDLARGGPQCLRPGDRRASSRPFTGQVQGQRGAVVLGGLRRSRAPATVRPGSCPGCQDPAQGIFLLNVGMAARPGRKRGV